MITSNETETTTVELKGREIVTVVWQSDPVKKQYWIDVVYRKVYIDDSYSQETFSERIQNNNGGTELTDWITENQSLKDNNKTAGYDYLATKLGITGVVS